MSNYPNGFEATGIQVGIAYPNDAGESLVFLEIGSPEGEHVILLTKEHAANLRDLLSQTIKESAS
jgi:hypothetical protein